VLGRKFGTKCVKHGKAQSSGDEKKEARLGGMKQKLGKEKENRQRPGLKHLKREPRLSGARVDITQGERVKEEEGSEVTLLMCILRNPNTKRGIGKVFEKGGWITQGRRHNRDTSRRRKSPARVRYGPQRLKRGRRGN